LNSQGIEDADRQLKYGQIGGWGIYANKLEVKLPPPQGENGYVIAGIQAPSELVTNVLAIGRVTETSE